MGKADRRRHATAFRRVGRRDHVIRIDAVARFQQRAQPMTALGALPGVELRVEREAAHRRDRRVEQPGTPQVQHHLRHTAGHEDLHRRVVTWAVGQCVDKARDLPVDLAPVSSGRPPETGRVRDCRHVQQQVRRAAEGGVRHHGVAQRSRGEDVARLDATRLERFQRERRPVPHVEPDRLSRWRERRMAEGEPECFADNLRRGRGTEELTAAAWRSTSAAAEIGGGLERDLRVREARADRLDARGVLAVGGRQRDAARHEDRGQIARPGQRHHHRRQPLVAGRDAEHAAPGRQGSDQPSENHRGVVPERQAVEHCRRSLRPPVARVGARGRERRRANCLQRLCCFLDEESHFPVPGVIAEGDRRAVGGAHAAVRRQDQKLGRAERRWVPAHAGVLAPAEQIARGPGQEHLGGEGQRPGRPLGLAGDVENRGVFERERIKGHGRPVAYHPAGATAPSRRRRQGTL